MLRYFIIFLSCVALRPISGTESVVLTDVPDYAWYAGCFGTASGNMMGYWDRHGFPKFYTGPTAGGVAPLDNAGPNEGICSLWASKAGFDGRPANQPGHIDDYWEFFLNEDFYSYESTATDPYMKAGRPDHPPDCTGDFIGSSQNKWADLDGECSGNIDAFSFTFWDKQGLRRTNYVPPPDLNGPVRDVPSGLRAWAQSKGSDAEVFSQLADFNPTVHASHGFTFADMKAEIDAGYPVMIFLQQPNELSRSLPGNHRANPRVHGMLAYGYTITDSGDQLVRYRTSWASGDRSMAPWTGDTWEADLPVRGLIGFHPLPKVTEVNLSPTNVVVKWDGPASVLSNTLSGVSIPLNWYVVEKTDALEHPNFAPIGSPTLEHQATLSAPYSGREGFFRVKMLTPEEAGQSR